MPILRIDAVIPKVEIIKSIYCSVGAYPQKEEIHMTPPKGYEFKIIEPSTMFAAVAER